MGLSYDGPIQPGRAALVPSQDEAIATLLEPVSCSAEQRVCVDDARKLVGFDGRRVNGFGAV